MVGISFIAATCPHLLEPDNRVEHKHPIALPEDIKLEEALSLFRRDLLLSRLEQHRWNVSRVAKSLGVSRNTLYRRLHRLDWKKVRRSLRSHRKRWAKKPVAS